jgi:hypothetical protein
VEYGHPYIVCRLDSPLNNPSGTISSLLCDSHLSNVTV